MYSTPTFLPAGPGSLFRCCLMPWQLWNSEEWDCGPWAQAGLSRVDVEKNFLITLSFCLCFFSVFCPSFCLVAPPPPIAYCLESSFIAITSCNAGKLWRDIRIHAVHTRTDREACKHESEPIKNTEAAETAGGGLWPHCTDWLWNNRAGHD